MYVCDKFCINIFLLSQFNLYCILLGSVYLRVVSYLFHTLLGSVYLRVTFNILYTLLGSV